MPHLIGAVAGVAVAQQPLIGKALRALRVAPAGRLQRRLQEAEHLRAAVRPFAQPFSWPSPRNRAQDVSAGATIAAAFLSGFSCFSP